MIERVVTFGPRAELTGILTQNDRSETRPAVLMWNVGVNHRVGPFRIYVDLARRLAELGFVAFRFDASGLGDSEQRRELVSDAERAELDIQDAMSCVTRRTGATTFVLVGFCSSVDAAHRVAVADARVVGVIHLEGYAYRTPGFYLHRPKRYLSKLWLSRFLSRRIGRALLGSGRAAQSQAPEEIYERDYPGWSAFTRDLERLSARAVQMLFVYVGGDTAFNHTGQFWEMFGSPRIDPRLIEVTYYESADHTFFGVEVRRTAIERIVSWLNARYGAAQLPVALQGAAPVPDNSAEAAAHTLERVQAESVATSVPLSCSADRPRYMANGRLPSR